MSATNTGAIAKLLWPGLNAIYGEYKDWPLEVKSLFDTQSSSKNYEEDQLVPGLGLAPVKAEGSAVQYDTLSQGLTSRYTHVAYAMGFVLTREALADNQYKGKALKAMKMLTRSFRQTKETVGHNVYNRAHNASYTFADGKVLCATDHPSQAGTWSNRLTTAADLSEASLEDLVTLIGQATDDRGLKVMLAPKSLHVPVQLRFEAVRILKSMGQYDTANNATNAIRAEGLFRDGANVHHYFDDADAFFIRTDAEQGMIHFEREAAEFAQDNDFDTWNLKYKMYERYSFGNTDARGVYSNGGGA